MSHYCVNNSTFLENLLQTNRRAGVPEDTLDLIESYASLRLSRNQELNFYSSARPVSPRDRDLQVFLSKNQHLDPRALNFLAAYHQEMKASNLACVYNRDHLAQLLDVPLPRLHSLSSDSRANYHVFTSPKPAGSPGKFWLRRQI